MSVRKQVNGRKIKKIKLQRGDLRLDYDPKLLCFKEFGKISPLALEISDEVTDSEGGIIIPSPCSVQEKAPVTLAHRGVQNLSQHQ